ncbi:bric-a-brac 1-like [Asbolus verrucosus]|uniref:Bric-a-brac 1-like n=1 Tax=Asbolus verrucosus TaxID=1661398 RepID=A0A482VI51_ASBVE|nr:bric-a-brac 1-like [Asbolus verrucosus]
MVSQSSTELYNLRWNSYVSNLINAFTNHQSQETLVDVTLSCEGHFIKAHRLVLSACSVYFQKIFETHIGSQLLVLLNDVKFKDLELVIQFMYKGEVKVADSEMQNFLSLGKMLQVKGLCSVELQDKQKSQLNGEERNCNDKLTQVSLTESSSDNKTKKSPECKTNNKLKIDQSDQTSDVTKEPPPLTKKRKQPSPVPGDHMSGNKKKNIKTSPANDNQDMSHIPRPPNAFMIFANQWRKKLAVEYPGDSNKDISVRLGNMWKSLSQETKDAFYEDARKADEEHKIKYPGYYYSPKEARNRKAIANISKAAQKLDSVENIDISEANDEELIEIKFDENGEHSTQGSGGTN